MSLKHQCPMSFLHFLRFKGDQHCFKHLHGGRGPRSKPVSSIMACTRSSSVKIPQGTFEAGMLLLSADLQTADVKCSALLIYTL